MITHSITRAYEAGATDFIAKPLNWLILSHRIRYMLRGARALDDLRENQERLRARRQQEHEQNQRFEAALGNMSQGLCMFGPDGRLIVTNRRFRDIYQMVPAMVGAGAVDDRGAEEQPAVCRRGSRVPRAAPSPSISSWPRCAAAPC